MKSAGHNSVVHVDDSYLQRETCQACLDNFSDAIKLLRELASVLLKQESQCLPLVKQMSSLALLFHQKYDTVINWWKE